MRQPVKTQFKLGVEELWVCLEGYSHVSSSLAAIGEIESGKPVGALARRLEVPGPWQGSDRSAHPIMLSHRPVLHDPLSHLAQLVPDQILSIGCLVYIARCVVRDVQQFFNLSRNSGWRFNRSTKSSDRFLSDFTVATGLPRSRLVSGAHRTRGHLLPHFLEGLPLLCPKSH